MKKIRLAASVMAAAFMCGVCAFAAEAIPAAVSRAASSVVRITVRNSFGIEEASGVIIDKKSMLVLTSKRLIDGSAEIFAGGNAEENIRASVTAVSGKRDLAVIELESEPDKSKNARLRKKALKEGDAVYALGYFSRDDSGEISEGAVNSKSSVTAAGADESMEVYLITAQVNESNRGGALTDKNGALAGVNFYDGNMSYNKAVSSGEVMDFLDEQGIAYRRSSMLPRIALIFAAAAAAAGAACAASVIVGRKKKNEPCIIGLGGECAGSRISIGKESINIGRDAKSCQVVITDDPKVSRCHCSVRYDSMRGMFAVTDLSSTHGTYINDGTRLEAKVPVYIKSGGSFRVGDGNTAFRVMTGGGNG